MSLKLLWTVGKQPYFLLENKDHSPHMFSQVTKLPAKLQTFNGAQNGQKLRTQAGRCIMK